MKQKESLFYSKDHGMYTAEFGNGQSCQTMKRLVHYANYIDHYFDKGSVNCDDNLQNAWINVYR